MLTSHRLIRICRIALAAGLFAPVAALFAYYGRPGMALPLSGGVAHMVIFYGLTALTFLSFPRNRRSDLCLLTAIFAVALELGLQFSGHGFDPGRLAADIAGVYAVMAPGWIERIRHVGRGKEWMSLSQAWRQEDRRGAGALGSKGRAAA